MGVRRAPDGNGTGGNGTERRTRIKIMYDSATDYNGNSSFLFNYHKLREIESIDVLMAYKIQYWIRMEMGLSIENGTAVFFAPTTWETPTSQGFFPRRLRVRARALRAYMRKIWNLNKIWNLLWNSKSIARKWSRYNGNTILWTALLTPFGFRDLIWPKRPYFLLCGSEQYPHSVSPTL